jgi:hypothetical protein
MDVSVRRKTLERIIRAFASVKTDIMRERVLTAYNNNFGGGKDNIDKLWAIWFPENEKKYPIPLYKYVKFDENGYWKEFFKGIMKLSPPKEWNDLADSLCVFEGNGEYTEYEENIREAFHKNQFATCFSESNNNMSMWYHYAGKYTGMVLSYDFKTLRNPQNLLPIVYADDIKISVETIKKYVREGNIYLPPFPMLIKGKEWEYEREWRLFGGYDDVGGIAGFREMKPALTEVYFGVRSKIEDILSVLILIELNFDSSSKPKLFKMKMDNTKNVLKEQPFFLDEDTETAMWQSINMLTRIMRD